MRINVKFFVVSIFTLFSILPSASVSKGDETIEPILAIVDTAINSNQPFIKSQVKYEVCILENSVCPNGLNYMEGPGAAFMPENLIVRNGFDHGTLMSSVAINTDKNVKILFVRMIGSNASGTRNVNGEASLNKVLTWLIENQKRLNIQSVVIPQGHHNLRKGVPNYCPITPITENAIVSLRDLGVPTFLPVGNGRDYLRIDWPACIPSAISIGATMPTKEVAIYSNFDSKLVDFFALGTTRANNPNGVIQNIAGTSASAVTAATIWAQVKRINPNLKFDEVYALFERYSVETKNSRVSGGKLIDHEKLIANLVKP